MTAAVDWLAKQPNWVWLLVVALVTHRLTLRREKWNREQGRRSEQRKAIADFSAAANGAAPQAGDLATWLERRRTATNAEDFDEANLKVDELISKFADKIFEIHRAADLLKMSLVDPELNYRASFVLKLAQDLTELGGDRRKDPGAKGVSLTLLERRCTDRLKQLLTATDELLQAAIFRIPPQTTRFRRYVSNMHFQRKVGEMAEFAESIDADSATTFSATLGDMRRPDFPTSSGAVEALNIRSNATNRNPTVREDDVETVGGSTGTGRVRITKVAGRDLTQEFVGRRVGRFKGGYNYLGELVELVPVLTDPRGLWRATIAWNEPPATEPQIEEVDIPFDMTVDFVELIETP
ncbi:hypothetical protein EEB14_52395 [Rhodococcus sp. WS4]|nr:hypothetical protein EEB14_52395 [Rhodococcus sp. WS4]